MVWLIYGVWKNVVTVAQNWFFPLKDGVAQIGFFKKAVWLCGLNKALDGTVHDNYKLQYPKKSHIRFKKKS